MLKFILIVFICCVGVVVCNWEYKVYPDERLTIDSDFMKIFKSIYNQKSYDYINTEGRIKKFLVMNVDSVTRNEKGWFINALPVKWIRLKIREVGDDTTHLERENEIFVNKDPGTNVSSICITFNNFYDCVDNELPLLQTDSTEINEVKISNYHLFETSLTSKSPDDVRVIYVSPDKGVLGFVTASNEKWVNVAARR
jgi:hypothetical protein